MRREGEPEMKKNSILLGMLAWLLFLALYLLLAGKASPEEGAAGAMAATITLLLARKLRKRFKRPLLLQPAWLLLLWRIPVAMLSESWLLAVALLRQLRGIETEGRLIEHPFTAPQDRHDSARRAFMTCGVCITPNSYLVYVDREKKRVLVRQLVGERISKIDRLFVELS